MLLLVVLAFVASTLYLHFGRHEPWGQSLLLGLSTAPFIVAMWKFRDWYMGRAERAGHRMRVARNK
ncbi:hypothetical protein ACFWTC_35135 [Streptomyces sp. NPDC058619]|uniref:hypothetical protein n=1 Tax=unclassified Streptomyces TaxID=2593676 RepID=UPI00365A72DF